MALMMSRKKSSGGLDLDGKYNLMCANGDLLTGSVSSSFSITTTQAQDSYSMCLMMDVKGYSSITIATPVGIFSPKIYGLDVDGTPHSVGTGSSSSQSANVTNYDTIVWFARSENVGRLNITLS